MKEILVRQGVHPDLAARIAAWLPEVIRHVVAHPQEGAAILIGVDQLAVIVGQAMAAATEETAASAIPTLRPAAPVSGSPLVNPQPIVAPPSIAAPPSITAPGLPPLLPQEVVYGRSVRGQSLGPVPIDGPPPPHVQIGGALGQNARVQIHNPAGSGSASSQTYAGDLSPGQTRVEISLPSGERLPPILKTPDGRIVGAEPAPLIPFSAGSALVNPAPPVASSGMVAAFDSVKIAGNLGARHLQELDQIEETPEDAPPSIALFLHLGLVELEAGRYVLTQNGREARAIVRNRFKASEGDRAAAS